MEEKFWLERWHTKDIGFHEQNVNSDLIAYFKNLNLKSGDCIFVPLCGKSKDMIWLAEQGLHVLGVELSSIACEEFFSELNVTPRIEKKSKFTKYQFDNLEIFCGNFFDLTKNDFPAIQAVYDCKALIALPPETRGKYLEHIIKCAGKQIKILLLTRETNSEVLPPPFPINDAEVKLLYGAYFDVQLLKSLSVRNIPERLKNRGYTEMTENVYLISSK